MPSTDDTEDEIAMRKISAVIGEVEQRRIFGVIAAVGIMEHVRIFGVGDPVNAFYKHLDVCRQCAHSPFHPCPVGEARLRRAVPFGAART